MRYRKLFEEGSVDPCGGRAAWRFRRGAFGFGGFGGAWGIGARRGDMKYLVLEILGEGPRHGYDIIASIEERYGFRPSPGSIYPTLQMLEDTGRVTSAESEGKRIYTITESGRELLGSRPDKDASTDFETDARHRIRSAARRLMVAVWGARGSGDVALNKVAQTLEKTRKEIYTILSGDES
jgi:DNA-binding PadR family transcriptional regulator